jgi:photosystem II stability/assembly factor-like uncharacterized protein
MGKRAQAMPKTDCLLSRRRLCTTLLVAGLAGPAHAGLTGIEVLDNAAIPVKNPASVVLVAIAAAGTRLVAAGEHGVIVYSDDNGVSWRQAAVPVDVTITCLTFATASLGWAAGHFGVILRTTDAGVTWVEQLNGIEANQLTMDAAQNAATQEPDAPGTPLAVRRAAKFLAAGPDKPFLCCLALSPAAVTVFGAYRMTMVSQNGGQGWADASLKIGDRFSHNLYAVAQIGADIFIAAEEGLVFRSSDGGATFPAVTVPTNVTLFGLTGTAQGHLIVFGVAGTCYRSVDRGQSWMAVSIAAQDNLTAGILLPGGEVLLGSQSGSLFVSRDDGVSFTALAGVPPMAVSAIALAPDHGLVFVGQTGVARLPAGFVAS